MQIALSIIQGVLIFLFFMAGIFKLIQTKENIVTKGGAWAADFSATNIKIIGAVELILSVILFLSYFIVIQPIIVQIATTGMGLIMLAAVVVHFRRKEYPLLAFTLLLSVLAFYLTYQICAPGCNA
jgi:hypothetical protein